MGPAVGDQDLHFVDEAPVARLVAISVFLFPLPDPPVDPPPLVERRGEPAAEPVPPHAGDDVPGRGPRGFGMHGGVGGRVVADADVGVQPYAVRGGSWVVGVDQTAFGGFEVVPGEGVGDAAKLEAVGAVEGACVEGDFGGELAVAWGGFFGYDEIRRGAKVVGCSSGAGFFSCLRHCKDMYERLELTHSIPTALDRYRLA